MIKIHLLPVSYGDTILVNVTGKENLTANILIDCGFDFENAILQLLLDYNKNGQKIDRFIVTHFDVDHIQSAIRATA